MDRLVVAGAPGLIHRGRVTRLAGTPLHNRSFLQSVRVWTPCQQFPSLTASTAASLTVSWTAPVGEEAGCVRQVVQLQIHG